MWKRRSGLLIAVTIIFGYVIGIQAAVHVSTLMFNNESSGRTDVETSAAVPNTPVQNTKEHTTNYEDIVIVTTHGPVRGYQMEETKMWQFFDIPYAAFDPNYPFQDPTFPDSWEVVREITEHSSFCPQLDSDDSYAGTPDCLTVSVFVPQGAKDVDVLFHVHGGDFDHGSGDPRLYGPGFLVPKQVILVLPNYRLGPLGFLCMQNSKAPGNAALKDLTMALNWTRENIREFGGNPLNIVVSGTGAGAAISQYLALAPNSLNFVSKVIIESGGVLSYWALDRTPAKTANELVKRLNNSGIEFSSHDNVINNTYMEQVIIAAKGIAFRPCVDGNFITKTPWNLLHDQKLNKSFMLGSTDRPGLLKAMHHTEESIAAINKDFRILLPNDLLFEQPEEKTRAGKRVRIQYFGNQTITLEHRNELSLYHTDHSYLSPSIRNARLLLTTGSTVYLYEFSFINNSEDSSANIREGAAQGDSLNYVFQRKGYKPPENTKEYKMINLMTNLWVSFVQTGKPKSEGIDWQELKKTNGSEEAWLSIDSKTNMKKGFHLDRLSLWTDIYDEHFIEHSLGAAHQTKPCILLGWFVAMVCFFEPLHS